MSIIKKSSFILVILAIPLFSESLIANENTMMDAVNVTVDHMKTTINNLGPTEKKCLIGAEIACDGLELYLMRKIIIKNGLLSNKVRLF